MTDVYIDADACPVKQEVYKATKKYGLKVFVVSNSFMKTPLEDRISFVLVKDGPDEADNWIAEHAGKDDIVITADIPLADRCLKKGARVLDPRGREFTEQSIGEKLAMRDLMEQIRMGGEITGGPPPFDQKARSEFTSKLHQVIQGILISKLKAD